MTTNAQLRALGLHNLTGSRKILDIVHKLGNCLDYNSVCEIETAQAQLVQEKAMTTSILTIRPETSEETIYTQFWVDNFDTKVDNQVGGGSIHTTHLMAFQSGTISKNVKPGVTTVTRTRNRKIFLKDVNINTFSVDRKKKTAESFFQTSVIVMILLISTKSTSYGCSSESK